MSQTFRLGAMTAATSRCWHEICTVCLQRNLIINCSSHQILIAGTSVAVSAGRGHVPGLPDNERRYKMAEPIFTRFLQQASVHVLDLGGVTS